LKDISENQHWLNYNKLDNLFDVRIRPLRSKNARIIFQIFVNEKNIEFFTTLDLQTKLDGLDIKLSKKEINGWLCSLHDGGLLTKKKKRGKPTTLAYDNKYTFDLWRLTPEGLDIANGIDYLLRKRNHISMIPSKNIIDVITRTDTDIKKDILRNIEETYIRLACLRVLLREGSTLNLKDLKDRLYLTDTMFNKILSSYLDQGLISEIETTKGEFLLKKILLLLGISKKEPTAYQLTEKGRKFAQLVWSSY
jgi:hypothetical protein